MNCAWHYLISFGPCQQLRMRSKPGRRRTWRISRNLKRKLGPHFCKLWFLTCIEDDKYNVILSIHWIFSCNGNCLCNITIDMQQVLFWRLRLRRMWLRFLIHYQLLKRNSPNWNAKVCLVLPLWHLHLPLLWLQWQPLEVSFDSDLKYMHTTQIGCLKWNMSRTRPPYVMLKSIKPFTSMCSPRPGWLAWHAASCKSWQSRADESTWAVGATATVTRY